MASIELLEGNPRFVLTELGRDITGMVEGVRVDQRLQPIFVHKEQELSRFVCEMTALVTVTEEGSRDLFTGTGKGHMVKAPFLVGVAVFTETRMVATMMAGEFFGGMTFQSDKDGIVLVVEMPYEQIASIELEMKTKAFGGTKPVGLLIHTRNPEAGAMRMKIKGTTTLGRDGRRVDDLQARFEKIAKAIATHSRPYAYPEAAEEIDGFLAHGAQQTPEGSLIALFEPDEWVGPAPAMRLSGDRDAVSASETTENVVSDRLARFCAACGQAFDGDERSCASCGEPRRSSNSRPQSN